MLRGAVAWVVNTLVPVVVVALFLLVLLTLHAVTQIE